MVLELACNQNILNWRQFINHDMYIIVAILAFFSHFSIRLCGKKLKFWKEITRLCNRNNYFTNIQWVEIFCLQLAGPPKVRETWLRGNGILFPKYCHYCEKKKMFFDSRKTLEIRWCRPRICRNFETIRTTYSKSERSVLCLK